MISPSKSDPQAGIELQGEVGCAIYGAPMPQKSFLNAVVSLKLA